jgi:hypothetical protein
LKICRRSIRNGFDVISGRLVQNGHEILFRRRPNNFDDGHELRCKQRSPLVSGNESILGAYNQSLEKAPYVPVVQPKYSLMTTYQSLKLRNQIYKYETKAKPKSETKSKTENLNQNTQKQK